MNENSSDYTIKALILTMIAQSGMINVLAKEMGKDVERQIQSRWLVLETDLAKLAIDSGIDPEVVDMAMTGGKDD